jgi:hypothetical protein
MLKALYALPSRTARVALALAASAAGVPSAFAQPTGETLSIGFTQAGVASATQAVPLSPASTFGIVLLLAASGLLLLRRRARRGGRLFGWMLALAAGTTLAFATGHRAISDAHATTGGVVTLINLTTSPATLQLNAFWQANDDPLTVKVTNTTANTVTLTSVSLDNTDLYIFSSPTDCVAGGTLAPSAQCTVTLGIQ